MRNLRRLLTIAAISLFSCPTAFCQSWSWQSFVKWAQENNGGPFLHTETVCEVAVGSINSHWHKITYTYYMFLGIEGPYSFYKDVDTGLPCTCIAQGIGGGIGEGGGSVEGGPPGSGETNCNSGGPNGQEGTYDNSATAIAASGVGSSGPAPSSAALRTARAPGGQLRPHPAGRDTAPPGSTAFTYTVPYRALPAGSIGSSTPPAIPACNPQGNPAMFEVAHLSATVTRYDLCTGAVTATIDVPPLPLQIRVTPDGSQAIVVHYGNAITFIDTNTNTVSGTIQTDPSFTPAGIAISADGAYALVTNYEQPPNAYLAVVDIASQTIAGTIPLDTEFPQSVFINPDGTLAWVTYPWDDAVEAIDLMTGDVVQNLAFSTPYSVAFNSTGTLVYVAGGESSGSVSVFNATTYALVASVPAGAGACDLRVSLDDAFVSVNNAFAQSITIIDTRSLTGTTLPVPGSPRGAVLAPTQ
jgi:DNA-binding beta-propeller fold protein YncE